MAKPGASSVNPSSKGSSPSGNVAGNPGRVLPAKAIAGPASPGPPAAMRKALAKKSPHGSATGFPGMIR
jgi:hypothetical protein